jgi:hypothetical protein
MSMTEMTANLSRRRQERKTASRCLKCGAAAVALAALLLAGCGEGKKEQMWTRLPGDEGASVSALSVPAASADASPAAPAVANGPEASASAASAATPASGSAAADRMRVVATTTSLVAAGISFAIPEGWIPQAPATPMRLAQYRLPGPAGDAELAVFAFGPGQGGSPEANVQRWVTQFVADGATSQSQPAEIAELVRGGLHLYLVRTSGTYTPTAMGMSGQQEAPRPGYALFGVVVEGGPQGLLFVKATGPKPTLDAQQDRLEAFVGSVAKE